MVRGFRQLTIACGLALLASDANAQRGKVGARVGAPAPEVDLPTVDGGSTQLSLLRGHPVVLSYWATWCPLCRAELSELANVLRLHGDAGLRVVSVNSLDQEGPDRKKNMKKVKEFVAHLSLPFDVAMDQRGKIRDAYGILALPMTVFIDSAGVVTQVHIGKITREELDRGIATIFPPR